MAYCDYTDVIGQVTEQVLAQLLSGSEFTNESARREYVSDMCDVASETIDAYIRARYNVPVTNSTAVSVLQPIAVDITVYMLWNRSPTTMIPEKIQAAYENALARVRDIQRGYMSLPAEALSTATDQVSGGLAVTSEDGDFFGDAAGFADAF